MNSFAQLIGQNQAVELLTQAVAQGRIAPAYLFVGIPGVGRGLAAKGFSQLILGDFSLANHPDFLWVSPTYQHQGKLLTAAEASAAGVKRKTPPQIRIEQIREITEFLSRPPLKAGRSLVIMEDAQTMTESAANALLKTLEEPGRATLILIAPSTDSLLPTLVSRCQRIPFYRLGITEMEQVLRKNGGEEILAHSELLAMAQGSPGEAFAAFSQLQSTPPALLTKLQGLPKNSRQALELAREIDQSLDNQEQLWLLDYLQYYYWQKYRKKGIIQELEQAKQYLLAYVGCRLVWDCTLLKMVNSL
jgi:DNA polymerase-3 subunit delta'